MNTTGIMKGEISKIAKENGNFAFLNLYEEHADRFDKKLEKQWQDYYSQISRGYSIRRLMESCDCAANTVRKWSTNIPFHRDQYVMIGCFFGLDSDEVSKLMTRYGGFSRLQNDNLQDIMYLRLLQITRTKANGDKTGYHDMDLTYKARIGMYTAEINRIQSQGLWTLNHVEMSKGSLLKGKYADPELYLIIEKSYPNIISSYHALSEYFLKYRNSIGFQTNTEFYTVTLMSSSMQRIFSCLTTESNTMLKNSDMSVKPMPRRKQIIAFCLHLGMPLEDINKALNKANMEELCPRDPFEAALMFVLQQLYYKDKRFGGKEMRTKSNRNAQKDLEALYDNGYSGLFGYVYSKLSSVELSAFLIRMDINLDDKMCI